MCFEVVVFVSPDVLPTIGASLQTIEVSIIIDAPINVVYEHMADPQNLMGLQPLLIEVTPVQESMAEGLRVLRYESVEAFQVLGVTVYRQRIRVITTLTAPPTRMDAHVDAPRDVHLDVEYHFAEQGSGTRLTEIMHINAPALLMGFVKGEALRAQQQVLANLKQRLESKP
jgi:hypothetical protein